MLVDLYSDIKLLTQKSKTLGLLRERDCKIVDDLSFYEQEIATTLDEEFHIRSVNEHRQAEGRRYQEFIGKISDSHIEIEKLGVCRFAREYTTIISLEDSLDYILHRKCGASIEAIRGIPGYDVLSRNLLKFNFEGLFGFSVDSFIGVDPKLDEFIGSLVKQTPELTNDVQMEFLLGLVKNVIEEAASVVEYVSLYYASVQPSGTSVIRSKSFCSFVLSTDNKLDGDLVIRSEGYDNYTLKVRSFGRKEYAKNIGLRYAE